VEKYSYSKINCFATCPQKFCLSYVERVFPKVKSNALKMGSNMSTALDMWRKTGREEDAVRAFLNPKDKEDILPLTVEEDPLRSQERGLEILLSYIKFYPDEPKKMVGTEFPFKLELEDGCFFIGYIDGIIQQNGLYLIEDKTATRLGDSFFKGKKREAQTRWYLWAALEYGFFKNEQPKALINAIYIHKDKYRFERDIMHLNKVMVSGYKEEILEWVKMIRFAISYNLYPKNRGSCSDFGECEYYSFCFLSGNLRETIIKSDFKKAI